MYMNLSSLLSKMSKVKPTWEDDRDEEDEIVFIKSLGMTPGTYESSIMVALIPALIVPTTTTSHLAATTS